MSTKKKKQDDPLSLLSEFTPSASLSEGARAVWDRIVPELKRSKKIASTDLLALELLCDAFSQYEDIRKDIKTAGLLINISSKVVDPSGQTTVKKRMGAHPLLSAMRETAETVRSLCRELGMTPSARRLMQVAGAGKPPDDSIQGMTPEQIEAEISKVDEELCRLPIGERSKRLKNFHLQQKKTGRTESGNRLALEAAVEPAPLVGTGAPPPDSVEISSDEEGDWIEEQAADNDVLSVDGK